MAMYHMHIMHYKKRVILEGFSQNGLHMRIQRYFFENAFFVTLESLKHCMFWMV